MLIQGEQSSLGKVSAPCPTVILIYLGTGGLRAGATKETLLAYASARADLLRDLIVAVESEVRRGLAAVKRVRRPMMIP